ncbi:MAG: Ribosomal RNA small subunit methyltransferase E [Rhodanobacteraceae bacterium]|nr:MAG: Ribosomal RNA small subunit methyltransferase E [Rhodanobacteraceae bacterium]
MREIRLFVDVPLLPGHTLPLPRDASGHALRVLRLKTGDGVTLFNGDGKEYRARLAGADPRAASVEVEGMAAPERESPLRITLIQSLARGEKMDWIIQKATELGVARIWPVASAHSEVRLDGTRGEKRLDHWRAVAIAACEQCGRNLLPEIGPPEALVTTLAAHPANGSQTRWMLHPGGATRLRNAGPASADVVLAVGPEGGFSDEDLDALREANFRALALGPRILRTETAGLAAIAALQACYGDF